MLPHMLILRLQNFGKLSKPNNDRELYLSNQGKSDMGMKEILIPYI